MNPETLPQPGQPAVELIGLCGEADGIRALLVLGWSLLVSAPAVGQLRANLERLGMPVVCQLFVSEPAAIADVVLPTTQ